MIETKIILLTLAAILFFSMIKLVLDIKNISRDLDKTFDRIIMRCDNMIAICEGAGKARKKLIKSRGRK
jgi:hypothetical protein